ncbi:MAG TPA: phosphate regulon sensor histidine kinase PhoR [Steroidobacteraceae bacterium]|jgi:two-component system phosphate regulon sensor histidine kinase PhoR|nr:phosphate regulon sensor histidine kinase PhoR [Steroidobacteraceae bacterium]
MTSGSTAFVYVALRVFAALALGALLGWLAGSVWLGVSGALVLYLAWNLWQLRALHFWLQHRSVADPPDAMGLWGDVVAQVVRLHRRKRFHKERLTRLFRELRRSTAAMPDGVIMLDPQGEIVWFNRKAGELLDLSRRADLGLRIDNLVRHPDFVRYLHGGQHSLPVIVRIDTPVERHIAFQLISYGEDQRLLMLREVTREVRMEQMRKDFVANASHELRSPLTVVAGYLENFSSDPHLGELAAPIAEMRRQTDRMTRIIEDLLELSRFEANDAPIKGLPVDVAAMAAMLRKDVLARPVHPRQVEVLIESAASLIGDEAMVQSAFSNLVDNAAKYTPAEGSVQIRWWTDEEGGHFSVRDTGPGIPAEHLPRLTERFYRVDPGRSRDTGGSGLGLAIVKHALHRHGGRLEIDSSEGRGSTFTCHFPRDRVLERRVAASA